jgi:pSer/pThr/pTyr-binding forkhead associated (FHA) protein
MTDKNEVPAKKKFTPDWLVRGVLTRIGDTFDKLTGRNWKPTSSLATSEVIERVKKLLDAEVKNEGQGKFVPHNIKLKTQWDKFSTDAEEAMRKLKNELLTAAIDHINDNRYHTYKPLKVEIKPDYFTEGVKLQASFEEFGADEPEAEINVTVPQLKVNDLVPQQQAGNEQIEESEKFVAEFTAAEKQKSVELKFKQGARLSVGRTKENDLVVDDASISKHHATLTVNPEGKFLIADTGSTNGTFVNGERIAYGRAIDVGDRDRVKFGSVEVFFRRVPKPTSFVKEVPTAEDSDKTLAFHQEQQTRNGSDGNNQQEIIPAAATAVNRQPKIQTFESKNQTLETRRTEEYPAPPMNVTNENHADEWRETEETSFAKPMEQAIKFDFGDGSDKS